MPTAQHFARRDEVVAASLKIIEREGLDALTMRRLADELGGSTMAIYRYVPSRETLLELAADAIEAAVPHPTTGPWDERFATHARATFLVHRRHPWVPQHYAVRRTPSLPAERNREAVFQIFRQAGFSEDEVLLCYGAYWALISGSITAPAGGQRRFTAEEHFEYGLATLLHGLQTQLAQRPRKRPRATSRPS